MHDNTFPLNAHRSISVLFWIWILGILLVAPLSVAMADDLHPVQEKSLLASPLALFQSIISRADGQRCPMYPSCSHYAVAAVKKHGIIKGWLLAGDRLLRCGRDETRQAPQVLVKGERYTYDPLEVNTFWWHRH